MAALDPRHDTTVLVVDLLDHPGSSRPLTVTLERPQDLELPMTTLDDVVEVDGVLESLVDGILVRGAVDAAAEVRCARCLRPTRTDLHIDVAELFRDPARTSPDDEPVEEGYEIRDGLLDIDALVRDALAPSVGVAPLCRVDCAGLCAGCGADLNTTTCSCAPAPADPRWSALAQLRLPDPDDTGPAAS